MVCWDFAASTAAAATAAEERAPCFFSQAWILTSPARRIPSGVTWILPSIWVREKPEGFAFAVPLWAVGCNILAREQSMSREWYRLVGVRNASGRG